MFNTYITRQAPAYPQKVTVNEHKAPTDDSVRIYDEMIQKAKNQIIDTYKVEDNELNGCVILSRSHKCLGCVASYKFSLNGEEYTFEEELEEFLPRDQAIKNLVEKMGHVISATLFAKYMKNNNLI